MTRRLLDTLSRIFLFGRGRPVALLILAWLLLLNLHSEIERTPDEKAATIHRIGDFFGGPLGTGRQMLFDAYQKQHPRQPQSNPVTIVAIDEASLKQIGQWPWPRNRTAELINAIAAHQPAAIALDIYMPEDDQTSPAKVADNLPPGNGALAEGLRRLPSHETQLAEALRNAPTVLGAAGFDFPTQATSAGLRSTPLVVTGAGDPLPHVRKYPWVLASLPELQAAARGQAILSVDMEGGVVRRMPLVMAVNGQLVAGLGMEMLRVATGSAITVTTDGRGVSRVGVADLDVPTQPNGEIWLHFARLAAGAARYVSAADILGGKADADLLAGKLVMIGLTGSGLTDQRLTALGEMVPGIEIQAQVVEALFDGRMIRRPGWIKWLETLVIALIGGFLIYLVPRADSPLAKVLQALPRASVWLTLALNLAIIGIGYLLFVHAGLLFDASAAFVVLSSVMGSLVSSALIEISRRNEILAQEQQRMREDAAKAAGELSAAGRIQTGSLPVADQVFRNEPRFELAALLEPARDIGGDLYDFFMIDEHRLGFVVGDVSGKGLPASIFMAVTKTLTKTIAKHVGAGPAAVAGLANAELAEINPEALFVTLLIGVLDVDSGQLTLVNAGHDGPWLIHRDGGMDHLACPSDAGGPPLCMLDKFAYREQKAQLRPGDTLVMYTDGITEAMDAGNNIYGGKRLEAALRDCAGRDIHAVLEQVRADVGRHVGDADPSDDMTLLVIRWTPDSSVAWFDRQFQQQVRDHDFKLNPFEQIALPHLTGRVLDFGCGMGNLAMAAAQRGCSVLALDGSKSAIDHLRQRALAEALPVEAMLADLRNHQVDEDFDCVVSIGLLTFFDCATAFRVLSMLQAHVRPGGIAVINVLVEGTTWLDQFRAESHCLFAPKELEHRFAGWDILHSEASEFDAPDQRIKAFATLVARKP